MSLRMTQQERETFLADLHVGVIGINEGDLGPLAVPVWYQYSPEVGVTVLTGADSRKARLLEESGRFSLCAQSEKLPYKYVSVEGPVVESGPATPEQNLVMAVRYLGQEQGTAYAAELDQGDQLRVVMKPERWRTVDYGKG